MNDPRYLHTEEKQEGETFFDVMNRLIARRSEEHTSELRSPGSSRMPSSA